MLDLDTRIAILRLHREGHGVKAIGRMVGSSKNTVRKVVRSGRSEVPALRRTESLEQHEQRVRALVVTCSGNLIRVHEELAAEGIEVAYTTLTGFCRRHEIGTTPKRPAGQYEFVPGEEMQHDTSPHAVTIGGHTSVMQCASLVLCHCRRRYAQVYPRWSRFEARVFLTEAIVYLGGAAGRCMLDNSTVIIAHGRGKDAVAAPEMIALADRFGFVFAAHEVGDANRSARVEGPFWHIERNFYPGRTFADLADLNQQLRAWCDKDFLRFRRSFQARPVDLYVAEQPHLRKLPIYVPEVYQLHQRLVDGEARVKLHTNRYSVEAALMNLNVEVRETVDSVRIFHGHRLAATHPKLPFGAHQQNTLPEHRGQVRRAPRVVPPTPQELLLRSQGTEIASLIDSLRKRHGGRAVKAMRQLHRMWTDYPTDAVRGAISVALEHGLLDLSRIERMVLLRVAGDIFQLPLTDEENTDG